MRGQTHSLSLTLLEAYQSLCRDMPCLVFACFTYYEISVLCSLCKEWHTQTRHRRASMKSDCSCLYYSDGEGVVVSQENMLVTR